MTGSAEYIGPSEAARRLGVSTKALRVYERHGLVAPVRTAAGWRAYGPEQMARGADIATLRRLGLSLAQIGEVAAGGADALCRALATHEAALGDRIRMLAGDAQRVRRMRADIAQGASAGPTVAFDLPWPWGGERFELLDVAPLTFIIGPLGSGKTRFAMRLAESWPGAVFLPLERYGDPADVPVAGAMRSLIEDGATSSPALLGLIAGLEVEGARAIVVDHVEQGLDQSTQNAVARYLRRRKSQACPLFVMTRSSSILDLAAIEPDEAIILCPANHSPPVRVEPFPGAPGYEAVATCLASPTVRARTEGVIAYRPEVA